MKKSMFLVAAAAVALASCSSDEVMQTKPAEEIDFSVVTDNDSRAATVFCQNNMIPGFRLYGAYKDDAGKFTTFIEEDLITVSPDGKCTQSETRYWPEKGTLDFYGLVNLNGDGFNLESADNATSEIVWGDYTPRVSAFTPNADVTKQTDLLYAVATDRTKDGGQVQMNFRHALSQIEFRAKNDNPQLHVVIEAVRVGQALQYGTYTLPKLSTVDQLIDHEADKDDDYAAEKETANRGTWSNGGGRQDYLVPFNEVAVAYGQTKDLTISNDGTETGNNSLLLVPYMDANQGKASIAWNPALDNNTKYNGSYIAVKCTIYNVAGAEYVEGSDVAVLHEGWAVIPVSFKWKQGKKYIYTINFTKGGNGGYEEMPDGTPTDTPVLTGIEFTVTVDDFVYGDNYNNSMNTDSEESIAVNNATIAAAFAEGGALVLNEDIVLTNAALTVPAGKKVSLNLNGNDITANKAALDAIVVEEGGELVIDGEGVVKAIDGGNGFTIFCQGKLTINGGTYESGVDENGEPNAVIYARNNGKIFVNGGNFPNAANSKFVLNVRDQDHKAGTAKIEARGGIYTNFNPGQSPSENPVASFVAPGYKSVEIDNNVWQIVPDRN